MSVIESSGESTERRGSRISGLDGLRGIAVLSVVFYHFNLFTVGYAGVLVFFVLSGHLITRTLMEHREADAWSRVRNFLRNRILRLAPVYFLFLGVMCAVVLVTGIGVEGVGQDLLYLLAWAYNLSFLADPGSLDGWGAYNDGVTVYTHFWSLGVEVQLYLLWAVLAVALPRRWFVGVVLALAASGVLVRGAVWTLLGQVGYTETELLVNTYTLPTSYLEAFAIGACAALPEVRERVNTTAVAVVAAVLLLGSTAWVTFGSVASGAGIPDAFGFAVYGADHARWLWQQGVIALCAGSAVLLVRDGRALGRAVDRPWLVWSGRVSYSMYVVHLPVVVALSMVLGVRGEAVFTPWTVALAVVALVVIGAASWLVHRYVEAPQMRRKQGGLLRPTV